ncbi:MAG: LysE family translocator [Gammaproteobacteria bacterium]|nr:LysE family translocator [Gammaproteobacteria bacterium]
MTENFIAYVIFASVAAFTPGPNNVMVSASGANFGYRRTIPHLLGIAFGFPVLLVSVGLGFGQLFTTYPAAHTALKVAGCAYLLFLAWKIGSTPPQNLEEQEHAAEEKQGKPLTFLQAAAFQWVNPKAWTVNVSAVAAFTTLDGYAMQLFYMVLAAIVIGFSSSSTWTLFGQAIGHVLSTPRQQRVFNISMGILLVASLYPILKA